MALSTAPVPLSQVQSTPSITVYPADLFTSTNTANPIVTGGGSGATANAQSTVTTANSGFYTQIQMIPADKILTGASGVVSGSINSGAANPQNGTGVYLPLPWKINDVEMHAWNDLSFIDQLPVINEIAKAVQLGGRATGNNFTVNPFLYMLYKQPCFREFELAWSFSPNNSQETQTLSQIINYLKTGALPAYKSALVLDYPYLALIRLNPNQYMFDFKPCAITSVNIDYTGSGHGPSFYNDGGPTIVNFTLGLKEVEIQVRQDTAWRAPNLTSGM